MAQEQAIKGTNPEVYAEVFMISDTNAHYVLPNKNYGQTLVTQLSSRNVAGIQAIPAYDSEGKLHYIVADNVSWFRVKRAKDTDLVDTIVALYEAYVAE